MGALLSIFMKSTEAHPVEYDYSLFKEPTAHDTLSQEKISFPVDDSSTPSLRNITVWTPSSIPVCGIVIISHGIHEHGY
jgi:hypothetical protein